MLQKMHFLVSEEELAQIVEKEIRSRYVIPCDGEFNIRASYGYIPTIDITFTPTTTTTGDAA